MTVYIKKSLALKTLFIIILDKTKSLSGPKELLYVKRSTSHESVERRSTESTTRAWNSPRRGAIRTAGETR